MLSPLRLSPSAHRLVDSCRVVVREELTASFGCTPTSDGCNALCWKDDRGCCGWARTLLAVVLVVVVVLGADDGRR